MFKKADKKNLKLKIALVGQSGSGKTYSALTIAKGMGGRICLIDSENDACSAYADDFDFEYTSIEPPYICDKYIKAIQEAERLGFDIIIIDSLSQAWEGEGGILDQKSELDIRKPSNPFVNWKEVKSHHNKLKHAIFDSRTPMIVTIRSKVSYTINNENGKNKMSKVEIDPISEPNIENEFTTLFELQPGLPTKPIYKDRTQIFTGQSFIPDLETGQKIRNWLNSIHPFTISDKEIKYVKTLLSECHWNNDQFKEYLQTAFKSSFKQLDREQYEIAIEFLKNQSEIKKVVEKENELSNDKEIGL